MIWGMYIGKIMDKYCVQLEPVIQSKVSQKEKNKYHILTHVCGIQKNGTDEPIFRARVETQRTDMQTQGARGGWDKLGDQD